MSEQVGFVQGPSDIGTGKRIANAVVTLPAGTVVTNADGTTTTLTVTTSVFLQRVVLGDPETLASVSVGDEIGRGKLGVQLDASEQVLERMDATLSEILLLLKMSMEI